MMAVRLEKPVEVPRITSLASGSIAMTGAEQVLVELPGGSISRVSGYIDLSRLAAGDTVIIRMYIRVIDGGEWRMYHQDSYGGPVMPPLVHVVEKPQGHGIRTTVQQTSGLNRTLDYEFFRKGGA